ncbi:uncharacterized protein V1516DRAFT_680697 [Lipomyces oligophaga]|uniref:uncharacterized protein n=1 Tax=Lipomyces oligophaga TaxID=45792 RepID=UPI0034CD9C18
MAPKKASKQKMSLGSFLQDASLGAWAEDEDDFFVPPQTAKNEPDRGSTNRYVSDRFSTATTETRYNSSSDKYSSDKYGADKYGSDKYGSDKYSSNKYSSESSTPSRYESVGPEKEFDLSTRGSKFDSSSDRYDSGYRSSRPSRDDGHGFRDREPRERIERPVPDEPPFIAYIGNLANEANEEDVKEFFKSFATESVRIIRGGHDKARMYAYAYVEFTEREGLVDALKLTESEILNRPVRINVADPPKEDRTQGDWRSGHTILPERAPRGDRAVSDGKVRDFDNWTRSGPLPTRTQRTVSSSSNSSTNTRSFDNWRSGPASREGSATPEAEQAPASRRPRLNLQQRTVPLDNSTTASAYAGKNSPFGSAAPVDTNKKIQEIAEARLERERKEAEAAKARREEAEAAKAKREERAKDSKRNSRPKDGADRHGRSAEELEKIERLIMERRGTGPKPDSPAPSSTSSTPAPPTRTSSASESKGEELTVNKQFDLLRLAENGDDFVPDEEEDEPERVQDSKPRETEVVPQHVIDDVNGEDWTEVPKVIKRLNGK